MRSVRPHWLDDPSAELDLEALRDEGVGLEHFELGCAPARVEALAAARGYPTQEHVEIGPASGALAAELLREHRHEEDEVRFVLEGEGLFDIRTHDDRWLRVPIAPG